MKRLLALPVLLIAALGFTAPTTGCGSANVQAATPSTHAPASGPTTTQTPGPTSPSSPTPTGGGGTSSSNYTQIVNGKPWPLDFVPFCKGSGQACPWNNPLPDNATPMSGSSSMISSVLSGGGMTGLPDMANGGTGSGDFAHPVYLAASTDPLVTLGSACGSGAGTSGAQIHIPAKARPTTSSDAHMGVIQPNGDEYDFWSVPNPSSDWKTGDTINCQDSGNYSNIVTGSGSVPHSATSGAALSAGDLRVNELENGVVPHGLFVVVQGSNGYVYPGQSNAAQGGTIPIGARIQLKYTDAQIDAMTGLQAWEKTLLHQLHDYGLYVLDTGGDGYITYKWESPTQYTSFGGTNPGIEWNNANSVPTTWTPTGINWLTDLQVVSACYAEGTC